MAVAPIIPLIIGIAGTAAGAAISISQAQAQNRALRRAASSARGGAAVQTEQLGEQAAIEMLQRRNRTEQIIGRVRAVGAEAGASDGSFAQLEQQAAYDEALSDAITERNYQSNARAVASGLDAHLIDFSSRQVSPILSGFGGGLSGASSGLQIGGAVRSYRTSLNTGTPEP